MTNKKKSTASAHDLFNVERKPLDAFFKPQAVAVIGATERPNSVGRTIVWNLMTSTFGGTIYPVSLKRKSVLGIKAYKNIADIPEPIDLAIREADAALYRAKNDGRDQTVFVSPQQQDVA